jgi:predicted O-linked N-acetylglucosamine transferase (SPINDLY family)
MAPAVPDPISPPISAAVERAMALHRAGRLDEAADLYRAAFMADPRQSEALHQLGLLACQLGERPKGIALIRRALAMRDEPGYALNLATALLRHGQRDEARTVLTGAVGRHPDSGGLHAALGDLMFEAGEPLKAVAHYRDAARRAGQGPAPAAARVFHNLATALIRVERLDEAAGALRRAVTIDPGFAPAYIHLGRLHLHARAPEPAVVCLRAATHAAPDSAEAWSVLGAALSMAASGQAGKPDLEAADAAILAWEEAARLQPDNADTIWALAAALSRKGRFGDAMTRYRQAMALRAGTPEAILAAGRALFAQGRLEDCAALWTRALARTPDSARLHADLAVVLAALGRGALAQAHTDRAISLDPGEAAWLAQAGGLRRIAGADAGAMTAWTRALTLDPGCVKAVTGLRELLVAGGRFDAALAVLRRALAVNPAEAVFHADLGFTLIEHLQPEAALAALDRALALAPDHAHTHYGRACALRELGRLEEALDAMRRAVVLDPRHLNALNNALHLARRLCDWSGDAAALDRFIQVFRATDAVSSPFNMLSFEVTAADLLDGARRLVRHTTRPVARRPAGPRDPGGRIRVGYVSADFTEHPVAFLIAEIFELHDRDGFEITGYSCGPPVNTPMRDRLIRGFDRFVDIGPLDHDAAAARIAEDGIDILVDLIGLTGGSRQQLFALRPAPVQVAWLGYPGTTGNDAIDYLLADAVTVPPDHHGFHAEAVVTLPHSYQPNDRKRPIAAASLSRAECGLPDHGFVFCCFNNSFKITPAVFGVWMRLLSGIPDSVLWLLDTHPAARANLRREAMAAGVDPDRIVFSPKLAVADHLARHRQADLFLDTLPYNAHTTASDALWAGLPVLTCRGETFAGRVAASLLHAAGLPDLVTASLADYEALALRLARDPDALRGLRRRLAHAHDHAPLFDSPRQTRAVEAAYRRMIATLAAGQPPSAFIVPADPA